MGRGIPPGLEVGEAEFFFMRLLNYFIYFYSEMCESFGFDVDARPLEAVVAALAVAVAVCEAAVREVRR